jgi:hypothetical protein
LVLLHYEDLTLKEFPLTKKETDPDFQNKLAYLAGVFDGEGSFGYWSKGAKRKDKEFVVQVEMRDMDIVGKFQEFFGCGTISYRESRKENHSPTHHWRVKNEKALEVLKLMMPYFGARRTDKFKKVVIDMEQASSFRRLIFGILRSYVTLYFKNFY